MLCIIALAAGGLILLKSDADYLLTLPISKIQIIVSFFIIQFFAYSIPLLYLLTSFFALNNLITITTTIALLLFLTSLSIISFSLSPKFKALTLILLVIWLALPFFGIYYSPSGIFFDTSPFVLAITASSAAISLILSARILMNTELELAKKTVSLTSGNVKNGISFVGSKGMKAISKFYNSGFMLTLRMNLMGISRISTVRVNLKYLLLATSILSLIFVILFNLFISKYGAVKLSVFSVLPTISLLIGVLFTAGTLSHERIWLAFTSTDPALYLRQVFISRFLTVLLLFLPFSVASTYLYLTGIHEGLNLILVYLVLIPSFSSIFIFITNWIRPVQIKEETYTATQLTLRDVMIMFFFFLVWAIGILSIIQIIAIASSVFFLSLFLYLTNRKDILRNLAYKLAENGFI